MLIWRRHRPTEPASLVRTGAKALARALASPACLIEELVLGSCGIPDAGGAALGGALEHAAATSRVRRLDLESNALGDEACCALGRALAAQGAASGSGSLRELCLNDNRGIGPAGAAGLAVGLKPGASALEALELKGSGVGSEGAAAIARALGGGGGGVGAAAGRLRSL